MTPALAWLGMICGSILGLLLLFLLLRILTVYRGYWRSAEKRWRDQVLLRWQAAQRQAQLEEKGLRRGGAGPVVGENTLREQAFQAYLANITVGELEAYPNIGPATIAKLRDAGYDNLAALCSSRHVEVPGLGPKRADDVTRALRHQVQEARGRFNARACREAQELERRLEQFRASQSEQGYRAHARLEAARTVSEQLGPLVELARRINFRVFVLRELRNPHVQRLLRAELPDLEKAVRFADEEAARVYAGRQHTPAPSAVAVPAATVTGEGRTTRPTAPAAPADLFRHALESAPPARAVRGGPAVPAGNGTRPEEGPLARLRLTVQLAFAVARADGRLARSEKAAIEQELRRSCDDDPVLLNRALALLAQYESAAIDLEGCLWQIVDRFEQDERQSLFDFVCRVADAAGERNQRETELLKRIATALGVPITQAPLPSPAPASSAEPSPPTPPADPRGVLEIDPSLPLTADLVRRQYNLLTERYAPEKFAATGAEFVVMAQAKRDAVKAAALALLEPLGEPLETAAAPAPAPGLRHNPDLDAMFGV